MGAATLIGAWRTNTPAVLADLRPTSVAQGLAVRAMLDAGVPPPVAVERGRALIAPTPPQDAYAAEDRRLIGADLWHVADVIDGAGSSNRREVAPGDDGGTRGTNTAKEQFQGPAPSHRSQTTNTEGWLGRAPEEPDSQDASAPDAAREQAPRDLPPGNARRSPRGGDPVAPDDANAVPDPAESAPADADAKGDPVDTDREPADVRAPRHEGAGDDVDSRRSNFTQGAAGEDDGPNAERRTRGAFDGWTGAARQRAEQRRVAVEGLRAHAVSLGHVPTHAQLARAGTRWARGLDPSFSLINPTAPRAPRGTADRFGSFAQHPVVQAALRAATGQAPRPGAGRPNDNVALLAGAMPVPGPFGPLPLPIPPPITPELARRLERALYDAVAGMGDRVRSAAEIAAIVAALMQAILMGAAGQSPGQPPGQGHNNPPDDPPNTSEPPLLPPDLLIALMFVILSEMYRRNIGDQPPSNPLAHPNVAPPPNPDYVATWEARPLDPAIEPTSSRLQRDITYRGENVRINSGHASSRSEWHHRLATIRPINGSNRTSDPG